VNPDPVATTLVSSEVERLTTFRFVPRVQPESAIVPPRLKMLTPIRMKMRERAIIA
jgi:hypothetical protein